MATHYPAGPWIRTILFYQSVEKQYQNDLWWKATGTIPGTTNANVIAAAVDSVISPVVTALMDSESRYIGNTTYINNGTFTWSAETNADVNGTASGSILPAEVAAIVRLNSGVATRAGNGRIFFPCVDSTMASESTLSVLGATTMEAICTALIGVTEFGTVACKLAVWSRKLNVLEPVLFCDPAPIFGHRRKRRPIH